MNVTVSPDLAESLRAAALDRTSIHHDLCTVFDHENQAVCTCGVPRLLADLAALLLSASPADVRVR